jgi:hypothetical protein
MTLVEWLSRRLLWDKNTCTKEQNMTCWVGHMAFDHTQRTKFLPMQNQQAHLLNGSCMSIPHFCNSLKYALTLAVNLVCFQFHFSLVLITCHQFIHMLVLEYVEVTAPAPAVVFALVGLLGFVSLEGHR